MISIFDYQNYREYLKDYYSHTKKNSRFTYAEFSKKAGIQSPNYYKLVMDGAKNLTSDNIPRFTRALDLSDQECDYFEALVHFNQASDNYQREFYQKKVTRIKENGQCSSQRTLQDREFEVMSHWFYHTLMVLTNVDGFRDSPQYIKERFYNLISEQDIAQITTTLVDLGVLVRDENNQLKQTNRQLLTKPELKTLAARIFYEGFLQRAIQSLSLSPSTEREFGAYIVGLSPHRLPELKQRVRDFLKELNDWAMVEENPTRVYALSFFGFPLTSNDPRIKQ